MGNFAKIPKITFIKVYDDSKYAKNAICEFLPPGYCVESLKNLMCVRPSCVVRPSMFRPDANCLTASGPCFESNLLA